MIRILGLCLHVNGLALGFALLAMVVGLKAAWLWVKASDVEVSPLWPPGLDGQPFAPVDPVHAQDGWIAGQLKASVESARLNASAARWTAWAVMLSTVAAVAGAVTPGCSP